MNAPVMSTSSRSFLRFREYSEPVGDVRMMKDESKREILEFMHRFEINRRTVYFAENIQTLTKEEVKNLVKELAHRLENQHGMLEFHPTGDNTSKSAHIHWWGSHNQEVEDIITDFIKEQRLSNKTYLNYTNREMQVGKSHKIFKDELIENEFITKEEKKEVKREKLDEEEIAIKNEFHHEEIEIDLTFYQEALSSCDDILEMLNSSSETVEKTENKFEFNDVIDYKNYLSNLDLDLDEDFDYE